MRQLDLVKRNTRNYVLVEIHGDTYPHRELLKKYGCYWGPEGGFWYLPRPVDLLCKDERFQKFADLTKALAEADADVTVVLEDA